MWIEITEKVQIKDKEMVTPYAGVWIEITNPEPTLDSDEVTPYAGVWIEIKDFRQQYAKYWSLPTRECGLKSVWDDEKQDFVIVTPYAGVWIEIADPTAIVSTWTRHSLRGSVD